MLTVSMLKWEIVFTSSRIGVFPHWWMLFGYTVETGASCFHSAARETPEVLVP